MADVPSARIPTPFLIGVFVVTAVIGAVIAYLGITGAIGTGIP